MWALYQAVSAATLLIGGPFLLLKRGSHYLPTLKHRLGKTEEAKQPGAFWIHAVSVGEAGVAAILAKALPKDIPLLVTTVTPTGQERARALLGDRAQVTYLPFEIGFAVETFFRRYRPSALVLSEGDLWPLVLREARRAEIPIAMISGRISDRTFPRLRRLQRFIGPLFDPVDLFGMQTDGDRERLLEIGIDGAKVETTGNLKFEIGAPDPHPELEAAIEKLAGGRPILVAGSTMRGEEELVLEAFRQAGGGEEALLVLAPRHPERWNEAHELVRKDGWRIVRRSQLPSADTDPPPDLLLLDSLGELAGLYRLANAVFIGGTLVPTGGHNPLEAAVFAAHISVGPSMENFREMAEHFDREKAWRRVVDARDLGRVWHERISATSRDSPEGERAARLVSDNRGSMERTLKMLEPLLEATRAALRESP